MSFNLHPPLVSFPISLIAIVSFLEIIKLFLNSDKFNKVTKIINNSIYVNNLLIFIFILLAYFSGYFAVGYTDLSYNIPEEILIKHHTFGKFSLFFSLSSIVFYFIDKVKSSKVVYYLYIFSLLLSLICVLTTGWYGGKLVFEYGSGVNKLILKQ